MLFGLIRKEIVHNVLSLRFMVTFVLFSVLILVSILMLTSGFQKAQRTYETSRSSHREDISQYRGKENQNQLFHENIVEGGGIFGDRPPEPLGIFVHGLEDDLPGQVNADVFRSRQINETFYRNPLFALFATPDYSYIVNIVVSLLSLLFVFDSICGEKERGTLKVVLANSVPRDQVLLGKWIGGYISLAIPFLIALMSGITYVYVTGALQLEGQVVERLAWIVGVSLLYVSLFFALGMMISTLTHRPSTALLVSLFVWICWILVIPNLSPVIAKIAAPVPTLQKINAEKIAVDRETQIRVQRVSRNMLGYGKKAEEMRERIEQKGENRKRKLDHFYQEKLHTQIELSKNLSRISPSASFTYASTDLANTGVVLFANFKRSVKRYEDAFREWGEDWHDKFHDDELPDNWFQMDQIPSLTMVPSHLDDTIDAALLDILLMAVFNVVFFMLSYAFFLRYDAT